MVPCCLEVVVQKTCWARVRAPASDLFPICNSPCFRSFPCCPLLRGSSTGTCCLLWRAPYPRARSTPRPPAAAATSKARVLICQESSTSRWTLHERRFPSISFYSLSGKSHFISTSRTLLKSVCPYFIDCVKGERSSGVAEEV